MKKIISIICLTCFITLSSSAANITVKEGLDITIVPTGITTSKNITEFNIPAIIKDDVIYDGIKIFKSGDKAVLLLQDYEKAGFFGNAGSLLLVNGYAYDAKENKRSVLFTRQIEGKDKTWVKVTCTTGLLLWPLLFFGFVRGSEAKLLQSNEINATTMSAFEY